MNVPPSEGSEGIVDIFVLSGSSAETRLLEENLAQGGYRVSLFEGSAELLESLNEGNPNLLICDATSLGQDGYDTCRQIKVGDSTWMIPVLILTRTTGLSDLLSILDCNADNFVSYPCDPAYLLSFIEGMLATPVERQTADLIKTQFKIQHDDKVYVVTADRRKLLEFLLSSFETAVTISADLSQAQDEAKQLSDSFAKIRMTSAEQARSLTVLNDSLRQKEKAEASLSEELSARRQDLAGRESEIARLESELEDRGARLATAEERIRAMEQEHAAVSDGHRANIDSLSRQVSELSAELETKIADLETTQHDLEDKAARCANAECTIAELAPQKEEAEKALQSLRSESEKIRAMLAAEQDRVQSAEQDLEAVRQEKEKAEEEMALAISGLREAVTLRDEELARVSRKLEEETIRADHTEERLAVVQHDTEQSETTHQNAIEALRNEMQQLESRLDAATAQLEEEDLRRKSIEEELELATAEREKSEERIREVDASLKEAESALAEQEMKQTSLDRDLVAAAAERNRLEAALQSASEELGEVRSLADEERRKKELAEAGLMEAVDEKNRQEEKIRELSSALEEIQATVEAAGQKRISLERDIADLTARNDKSEEGARSLSQELEDARSAVEEEKRRRESAEAGLASVVAEKERFEQEAGSIQAGLAEARSELEIAEGQKKALEEELAAAKQDQDRIESDHRTTLQALGESRSALDLERGRIEALERQLVVIIREKEELEDARRAAGNSRLEADQKAAELEKARQETGAALERVRALEEELRVSELKSGQEEEKAGAAEEELEKVRAALISEQQLRTAAEMGLRSLSQEHDRLGSDLRTSSDTWKQRESEHSSTIQQLNADLKAVLLREEALRQQVGEITREKELAGQNLEALSLELQQARSALADEWEDHMNADEQLAASSASSEQLQKAEEKLSALTDELQQARTALADEWESHMTAAERLEEADRKNDQLRQPVPPTEPRRPAAQSPGALVGKERQLPITIKPFPLALAKTDIPRVHPVHAPEPDGTGNPASPKASGETLMPVMADRERSTADLRLEDLFEDEPGEVYSGSAPEQPAGDLISEPESAAAEAETPEPSAQPAIIPEEGVIPGEPAIPGEPEPEFAEEEEEDDEESGESPASDPDATGDSLPQYAVPSGLSFNRKQWFDLFAWARHAESLSSDQRMQIIRMGRLVQRGRKLTVKQEEQIRELVTLAQAHGYRFS